MPTTEGDLNITGRNFGIFTHPTEIGTTPNRSLHVEQDGLQDNYLHINAFGDHPGVKVNQNQPKPFDVNNGQLRVTADGNVGIGTTEAPAKLSVHVDKKDSAALMLTSDTEHGSWAMIHVCLNKPSDGEHRLMTGRKRNRGEQAWLDWTLQMVGGEEPQLQFFRAFRPDGGQAEFKIPFAMNWNGNVGIGTTTPNACLSVVAPNAHEIQGNAHSTTLLTSSGSLGSTAGDELALASLGCKDEHNNTSLGIRARRTTNGNTWNTTAIGLGMDVDHTVRAGASLWLHANGNVGIGTDVPQKRLHVKGNADVLALEGSNHAYIEWYPDGYTAGRKAWLGFGNANDNNLTICNQIAGADIVLSPASGNVQVKGTLTLRELKMQDASGHDLISLGLFEHPNIQNRFAYLHVGGQNPPVEGVVEVRNAAGRTTVALNGSSANITLGDGQIAGSLQVRNASAKRTILVDGASGDIFLYDASERRTIHLDAQAGDIILENADCAEEFDIAAVAALEPGTVVVLDDDGKLGASAEAYDRRVAGVISGAGAYRPGIVLDRQATDAPRQPVALVGKVYCKVDASFGAISVGDLLTTAPTSGHAMRANDPAQAFGAVLGKALRSLSEGRGLIPILVALQ